MTSGHEPRKQRPEEAMSGRSTALLGLHRAGYERRQLHGISSQHGKPTQFANLRSCNGKKRARRSPARHLV